MSKSETVQREQIIYLLKELLIEIKLSAYNRPVLWEGIERIARTEIEEALTKIAITDNYPFKELE